MLFRSTAHVVVDDECFADGHAIETLMAVKECAAEHFDVSIHHSTFQIETQAIADLEPAHTQHD